MGWKELDDAEIKSHLKYTKDWDQAKRFVKTKKRLPEGLLAFATAPLHRVPYEPDVIHGHRISVSRERGLSRRDATDGNATVGARP